MARSDLRISPATRDEVNVVLAVLNEAAQWVVDRGAEGWHPGQWREERLLEAIDRGETFLARRSDTVVATVTLQWADDTFWADRPPDAGYVHRLAVAVIGHGRGIGTAMLAWAEDATRNKGRSFLRLDCPAGNPSLRAYYESHGFEPRGEMILSGRWGTYEAARYEKALRNDDLIVGEGRR